MLVDVQRPGTKRAMLNFFSRRPWMFVTDLDTAELFASHASLALQHATATDHSGLR